MAEEQRGRREVSDNYTDDAAWDRRHPAPAPRICLAGVSAVSRSRDFVDMMSLISAGEIDADSAPKAPDPEDRACSKRQWERRMQVYRAHVKAFIQQATSW